MEKVASTVMFPCRYQQSGKYIAIICRVTRRIRIIYSVLLLIEIFSIYLNVLKVVPLPYSTLKKRIMKKPVNFDLTLVRALVLVANGKEH